jgi:restriction system protein
MPKRPSKSSADADRADYFVRDAFYTLEAQANAGRNPIVVIGAPGTGKTHLVHQYVEAQSKVKQIRQISAVLTERQPDEIRRVLSVAAQERGSVLLIDEAEHLGAQAIGNLLQLLKGRSDIQIFLISDRNLAPEVLRAFENAAVIVLEELSYREFEGFLHQTVPEGHVLPRSVLERFYERSRGNPRMMAAALNALRAGVISSEDNLLESFSDFSASGLVGPDGRPIGKNSKSEQRIIIDASAANAEVLKLLDKQPDLLWQVPSRRFEELVAEILHKQGYEIELTPASADGGFDMYAAKKDGIGTFLYLVECKRYTPPNKVGVEIVRALNGVVQSKQATAGAIVTTSYFTTGAEKFQREQEHRMHLHDYIVLRRWVSEYSKQQKVRP